PTRPIELPGVLLAALATLGLGLVLGPEAPLIALGMGLGFVAMRLIKKDAPEQALALMAAAGSFAAVSTIFGSPVIGAIVIIEAAGLGGAMLPLVLLPGLLAAGIGSLVFVGLGSWSGFSTAAWKLSPFPLAAFGGPGPGTLGTARPPPLAPAGGGHSGRHIGGDGGGAPAQARRGNAPVPAHDRSRARRRRARDRLQRIDGRAGELGAVLGRGRLRRALQLGRNDLALDTRAPARVQRARLGHLPRQLPPRPDVPGAVPRRRRRPARRPLARIQPDAGCRRAVGRRLRIGATPPAHRRHDREPPLHSRRPGRRAVDHPRRRSRLHHQRRANRIRRRPRRAGKDTRWLAPA